MEGDTEKEAETTDRDGGRLGDGDRRAQGGAGFGGLFLSVMCTLGATPIPTLPSMGGVSECMQGTRGAGRQPDSAPPWPQAPADTSGRGRERRPLGQPDRCLPGV